MTGVQTCALPISLTNATNPYIQKLANEGIQTALQNDAALLHGLNMINGHVTHNAVAEAFDLNYTSPENTLKN